MVKSPPSPIASRKPSKVEGIKENSNFLREPVATEVLQDTTHFSEDAVQLLKFGSLSTYTVNRVRQKIPVYCGKFLVVGTAQLTSLLSGKEEFNR
ncbi:hypothetical protein [Tolypothrix sp. PCC 7601]|uniref:hypothetical protein n=1 Tax=Tolypothrix sp. PCC 7601 TaxID=1188 RepID=UPI0021DF8525|nr:hypothetical protein [Tolypothrix sp. PCC 7601]UYD38112.1 hypothetical protein HG267_15720 [Tolypothrix sp. PCC 7601]